MEIRNYTDRPRAIRGNKIKLIDDLFWIVSGESQSKTPFNSCKTGVATPRQLPYKGQRAIGDLTKESAFKYCYRHSRIM